MAFGFAGAEHGSASEVPLASFSNMKPFTQPVDFVDHSVELLKGLLSPVTELPQDDVGLERVLFPWNHGEQHGQIPVLSQTYLRVKGVNPTFAEAYLRVTDMPSTLCVYLSNAFDVRSKVPSSEGEVSTAVQNYLYLFRAYDEYSADRGTAFDMTFNKSERQSQSESSATRRGLRPDTLGVMSGRTILVGEDKLSNILDAEKDLLHKMEALNPRFYGDLPFILGYAAAGTKFEWLFIGKNGGIVRIEPKLDLAVIRDRGYLILSIFNAFSLIREMAERVPKLPVSPAMYTSLVKEYSTIFVMSDSVRKTMKNFKGYCDRTGTNFEVVKQAYDAVKGGDYLPNVIEGPKLRRDTYKVEFGPLGYFPMIRFEGDVKMLTKSVCNALNILHEKGFVHRDVRLPNIVEVTPARFMLIDLETVAEYPFHVDPSFQHLADWNTDMLEHSQYTPKSDMYQLGKLLSSKYANFTSSPSARQFISRLLSKQVDANTALEDPWLKVDGEMSGLSSLI